MIILSHELVLADARWRIGLSSPEELVCVAAAAVCDGIEDKNLIALAGLTRNEREEAEKLFSVAMTAAGRAGVSKEAALRVVACDTIRKIIARTIGPYDGAKEIWRAVLSSGVPTHEYDSFIYAASEYEDRCEERDFFAREILREAQRCVSGPA